MFILCVSGQDLPKAIPSYGKEVHVARKNCVLVSTFIPTHNPQGKRSLVTHQMRGKCMNDRHRRIYEAALRAVNFMTANASDFQSIAVVQTYVASINTANAELLRLGADKVSRTSASRVATHSRGDSRDLVRDAMRDIAEMWRTMFDELDEAPNRFRMPYGGSDQNLLATARSFHAEVTPLASEFTVRGMPEGFLGALQDRITIFAEAVNLAETTKRERVGANAGFEEPARTCLRMLEKLDPIVKITYRGNPPKLAQWLVASHIERAAQRSPSAAKPEPQGVK